MPIRYLALPSYAVVNAAHSDLGPWCSGDSRLDEAATLALASNDKQALCETRLYQAVLYNALGGDPMHARAAAEASHDLAVTLGDRYTQLHSRIWLGCALHTSAISTTRAGCCYR